MYLVSSQQMRDIDEKAIVEWQIPELILMENAGISVVKVLKEKIPDLLEKNVTILVGNGNNGGDGLVIARHLYNMGVSVKVFTVMEKPFTTSAQANLSILEKCKVKIYRIDGENSLHLFKANLNYADVVIDAILGLGGNRPVSQMIDQVLNIINKRRCLKVAVDLPTGLNADTGEIWGNCMMADYTVTLALPKRGQFLGQGLAMCGELIVGDIGLPRDVYDGERLDVQIITEDYLATSLSNRERTSHKGTFGHLLVAGGSVGMSGAMVLVSGGALRSGVGKVTCAVPEKIALPVTINLPEAMVYPLPDRGEGKLTTEGMAQLQELLAGKEAMVIGPGLGCEFYMGELFDTLLRQVTCPLVIDADGLNVLANQMGLLSRVQGSVVLTPHPGEMAKLTGLSVAQVQSDRLTVAQDFARKHQVWVVLKGANTIIAAPEGQIWVNTMDSPALAVAGSGDILAGMIGAFLAQGFGPSEACCIAVNLHGRAGVAIAGTKGEISSKAGDIIDTIPEIIRGVLK